MELPISHAKFWGISFLAVLIIAGMIALFTTGTSDQLKGSLGDIVENAEENPEQNVATPPEAASTPDAAAATESPATPPADASSQPPVIPPDTASAAASASSASQPNIASRNPESPINEASDKESGIDFIIQSLTFSPERPTVDQITTFTGEIENAGKEDSKASMAKLRLLKGNEEVQKWKIDVEEIAAEKTLGREIQYSLKEEGEFTLELCADYENNIKELNEENNCKTTALTIGDKRTPEPDPTPASAASATPATDTPPTVTSSPAATPPASASAPAVTPPNNATTPPESASAPAITPSNNASTPPAAASEPPVSAGEPDAPAASPARLTIAPASDSPSGTNNEIPNNDHDLYLAGIFTFRATHPLRVTAITIKPNTSTTLDVSKITSVQLYGRDNIQSNNEYPLTRAEGPGSDGSIRFSMNWTFPQEKLSQDLLIGFSLNQEETDANKTISFEITEAGDIELSEGSIQETTFPLATAGYSIQGPVVGNAENAGTEVANANDNSGENATGSSSSDQAEQEQNLSSGQSASQTTNSAPEETCESRGLFTYTGPDKPGERTQGMCIECSESQYIALGGTCTEQTQNIVAENGADVTSLTAGTQQETPGEQATALTAEEQEAFEENEPAPNDTQQNVGFAAPLTPNPAQIAAQANDLIRSANSALAMQQNFANEALRQAAYQQPSGQPSLQRSPRLTYVPERGQTGPGIAVYFGIIGVQTGYLLWRRKAKK